MAEVTVVVGVHEEMIGAIEENPDSFVGYGVRRSRFRVDAEWVVLDPAHHWMLVIGGYSVRWVGPYLSNLAIEALASG